MVECLGVSNKAEAKQMILQRLASCQSVVLDDDGVHLSSITFEKSHV